MIWYGGSEQCDRPGSGGGSEGDGGGGGEGGGGQECRSKLQKWYNKVTHRAEQQTTKQTCPTFYSPACLSLTLCCRLLQWHLIRSSQRCCLKWDDCARVCVCSQIEQRVYCNGESGRLYYQQRNSDYFTQWVRLHTCRRNFSNKWLQEGDAVRP